MHDDDLDLVFGALSDPTRRAILLHLAAGEATVAELSAPFEFTQPTISRHLKVLEDAGLIETSRDAQRRPRKLADQGLEAVSKWVDHFHQEWGRRFDRLDAHLAARKTGKST